jgi:hypothetical protein
MGGKPQISITPFVKSAAKRSRSEVEGPAFALYGFLQFFTNMAIYKYLSS